MKKLRHLIWIILPALILFSFSCSTGRDQADVAIKEFRLRYARGAYKEIYDAAAPELQKVSSEKDFLAFLEGASKKLGTLKSSKETNWRTFMGTNGRQLTIAYQSEFSGGSAKEEFVWAIKGNTALLLGYHISSSVFVTK